MHYILTRISHGPLLYWLSTWFSFHGRTIYTATQLEMTRGIGRALWNLNLESPTHRARDGGSNRPKKTEKRPRRRRTRGAHDQSMEARAGCWQWHSGRRRSTCWAVGTVMSAVQHYLLALRVCTRCRRMHGSGKGSVRLDTLGTGLLVGSVKLRSQFRTAADSRGTATQVGTVRGCTSYEEFGRRADAPGRQPVPSLGSIHQPRCVCPRHARVDSDDDSR